MTTDLHEHLQSTLGSAYTLERELGGGGMARVFVATEAALGRRVVVKVLPPEVASEVSAERFRREIRLAAHLQHPHIVPVLSAGSADGLLYYTMPFVDGESLRDRLRRERQLPVDDAVRIACEVAGALDHAHRQGVLHRDVKPENVLLEDGQAVVADFGVARAIAQAAGETLTSPGLAVGTPAYMSPEQATGERDLDARSDVYALGCVLYEMLAGQPPFTGPTPQAVIAKRLVGPPPLLRELRPSVPAHVERATMRALALVPADRFATAADVARALQSSMAGAPTDVTAPSRQRGRVMRPLLVGGVTALALALGAAAYFTRASRSGGLDENLLAVAPFDVFGPEHALWREGMVDLLSRNLDGAGPLRTVPPTVVIRRSAGRADPAAAAALGRRTGARLVVYGSVVGAGDSVRITATLLDAASGRSEAEVEVRGHPSRIDRLADSLTLGLLRELGRTRPVGAVRRSALGATSLPALKAFLRGEYFYRRSQWDSVVAYHQRAVALDSTLALSYWHLYRAHTWGLNTPVDSTVVREWRLRARALAGRLAPRESLLVAGALLREETGGDFDAPSFEAAAKAIGLLEELTRRYPEDAEAWYELGEAHFHRFELTLVSDAQLLATFDRAIVIDPAFAPAYGHAIQLALVLYGVDSARRYIAAQRALGPGGLTAAQFAAVEWLADSAHVAPRRADAVLNTLPPEVLFAEVALAFRRGTDSLELGVRVARALFAREAVGRLGADYRGVFRGAIPALLYRGHVREAYERSVGREGLWSQTLVELALFGPMPDDTARARFAVWLATGWLNVAGRAEPWWGARGDTATLLGLARLADSAARAPGPPDLKRVFRHQSEAIRAYLALARRDTAGAVRHLLAVPDSAYQQWPLDRLVLAQLLSAQGRDREAWAVLGEPPFVLRDPARIAEVFWALERARVAERLGERRAAAEGYQLVAAAWVHADPELQPYVAEANQALARLQADRAAAARVPSGEPPRE
jgi:eukaryotic-like serine/threonine-protein kinase